MESRSSGAWAGAAYGLTAAALFGLSAPLARQLLAQCPPLLLAGLLYLGGGLGLMLAPRREAGSEREAPLRRSDVLAVAAIIVLGGMCGPILMLVGLQHVSAVTGSLLLNLEGPLTMFLALAVFGEHLDPRELSAACLIFAGALVLSASGVGSGNRWGVAALALATLSWAIDNNLTQRLSLRDPRQLAQWKTLGAGSLMVVVAWGMGQSLPQAKTTAAALLVGTASYGISVIFDIRALRLLGAARESAYFATAPFIGALGAVLLTGESFGPGQGLATLLMATGVVLLFTERHQHEHLHDALVHEHRHSHDQHHDHPHAPADPPGPVHSHVHRHEPLRHSHAHVSDAHHRHSHGQASAVGKVGAGAT